MKKEANNKSTLRGGSPVYVDETRVVNITCHFTRTGDDLRTRSLPTIIYYKDTTTFNNNNTYKQNIH